MNRLKLLPYLLTFSEIVSKGSFTAAARSLGISKSAASQQLGRLEKQVGIKLLIRNTRGFALTDAGRNLLEKCDLLNDQVERAFGELQNAAETPSGTFTVTFPHALEQAVVYPAIARLCEEFPLIEPNLIASDERKDLIRDKIDVALYSGNPPDSQYRAQRIGTLKEIFCATPAFLHRYGQPGSVEDLVNFRWIATSWQKLPLKVYTGAEGQNAEFTANPAEIARVNTLPGAIDLALQDMGLIFIPENIGIRFIREGRFVHLLEECNGPDYRIYFMHGFQQEKPAHVERFNQLVQWYLKWMG